MPTNLQTEFDEGRAACLEGVARTNGNCPHYRSSDSADAWHAGHAYESRRPSVYGPSVVTKGRGYRINVTEGAGYPKGSKAPRLVYLIDWDVQGSGLHAGAPAVRMERAA